MALYPKKNLFFFLLLVSFFTITACYTQGIRPADYDKKIAVADIKADLQILHKHLFQVHGSLFTYHSKEEFAAFFEETASRITSPMTTLEAYTLIGPINKLIADSHTSISLPDDYFEYAETAMPLLPLGIRYLQEQLYITVNLSENDDVIPGSTLVAINGRDAMQLFAYLRTFWERDGYNLTSPNRQLASSFMDYFALLIDQPKVFKVDLISPNGEPYSVVLASEIWPVLEKRLDTHFKENIPNLGPKPPLEFQLEDGVGYLRIRSFHPGHIRRAKQKVKPFFRQVFEELAVAKAENLIIDIRNNGGGSETVFMPLLSYLLDEPFIVYRELSTSTISIPDHHLYPYDKPAKLEKYASRRLTRKGDRYWDLKDPSTKLAKIQSPHFAGNVYIIINEQSYSAAGDFCGVVQQQQRATFIGAETGGNPYVNVAGESLTLVLPHTKIRAEIPILKFVINNDQENKGHGMMPDHPVPITIQDALVYKDPVLPFVKELIAKQQNLD